MCIRDRYTSKLEDKAWEGVLIGYDNDSPTYRIYDRSSGKIFSSRNVTFIEQVVGASTHLPKFSTPTSWGENIDMEQHHPDQHSEDHHHHVEDHPLQDNQDFNDNVFDGISQLDHGDSNSTSTHPMRLRSSGNAVRTSSTPTNPRQKRALQNLALTIEVPQNSSMAFEAITHYIGTVGIETVIPPASIPVPNNFKQASSSPYATKWKSAMLDELRSLDEHRVADIIPAGAVPPNTNIIDTRWVYKVKADGRFKARLVVQGWMLGE